jgi:hypothetical protein
VPGLLERAFGVGFERIALGGGVRVLTRPPERRPGRRADDRPG